MPWAAGFGVLAGAYTIETIPPEHIRPNLYHIEVSQFDSYPLNGSVTFNSGSFGTQINRTQFDLSNLE